jgi:hypothetical protein
MNQAEVYRRLKSSGILMDYIVACYDVLHTFGRLYLVDDITSLMKINSSFARSACSVSKGVKGQGARSKGQEDSRLT